MPRDPRITHDAIVDSALALFVEHGYDAVRIEDVARAAGVTRATFYNHFADREAVLGALLQRLLGEGEDGDEPSGDRPPLERIRELVKGAVRRMLAQEELARLVYGLDVRHERLLQPEASSTPVLFRRIHRLLDEAAARGEIRGDVPVELQCAHVHGALETAMRAWAEGRVKDPVQRADVLVDLALNGVAARDGR